MTPLSSLALLGLLLLGSWIAAQHLARYLDR